MFFVNLSFMSTTRFRYSGIIIGHTDSIQTLEIFDIIKLFNFNFRLRDLLNWT